MSKGRKNRCRSESEIHNHGILVKEEDKLIKKFYWSYESEIHKQGILVRDEDDYFSQLIFGVAAGSLR